METRSRRRSSGGALSSRNPNAQSSSGLPGQEKSRSSRAGRRRVVSTAAHSTVEEATSSSLPDQSSEGSRAGAVGAVANASVTGGKARGTKRTRGESKEKASKQVTTVSAGQGTARPGDASAAAGSGSVAPPEAKRARVEDEDPIPSDGSDADLHQQAAAGAGARNKPYTDIDLLRKDCANQFYEYAPDIYEHMKELEIRHPINTNYCEEVQRDIRPKMRAVLVDWLVEVIEEYRLLPETLYAAVQYLDRYLSVRSVDKQKLQLLGCACMLIAAKFEEIYMPMAGEFVYITDSAYTRQEILAMEGEVLRVLQFQVKAATSKHFMTRFLHAAGAGKWDMTTNLTKYLCELSLLEYRFLQYRPSQITASAILIARRLQGIMPEWTPTLKHYTGFDLEDLLDCALDLTSLHHDAPTLPITAVYQKYTHSPYMRVAKAVDPLELPEDYVRPPSCSCSLRGNTY